MVRDGQWSGTIDFFEKGAWPASRGRGLVTTEIFWPLNAHSFNAVKATDLNLTNVFPGSVRT